MARKEQMDELFRTKLSEIINREAILPNGLITITHVDASPDLQNAKVFISVLPENVSGTALKNLRKSHHIFKALKDKKILRRLPKFTFHIDDLEKRAHEIDDYLQQIKKEEEEE